MRERGREGKGKGRREERRRKLKRRRREGGRLALPGSPFSPHII